MSNNNILLTGEERDAYIAARFTKKLTGQELLDYVHANPLLTHTERCTAAGYLKDLDDGSQGCNFTEYFEAILDARKANGEYQQPVQSGGDWYDSLDDDARELYDAIEERCPEFQKLDAEQCQDFMDELSEHGITTAEQFSDAYSWQSDSYNPEREFAQYYAEEIACISQDETSWLVIDWQATWDRNLCYDFFTIEFDGETYFFNNNI